LINQNFQYIAPAQVYNAVLETRERLAETVQELSEKLDEERRLEALKMEQEMADMTPDERRQYQAEKWEEWINSSPWSGGCSNCKSAVDNIRVN
jgi:hypothetical protein